MAHFIFNGIDSRDKGVGVKKLPPRVKPKQRVELIQVPGRNGFLTQTDGTYESMSFEIECWLKKDADVYKAINWLKGSGILILSDDLEKQYDVVIVNAIPFERIFKHWRNFIIQFEVQPFSKGINKQNVIITSPTLAASKDVGGNIVTNPIVTLIGNGNFTVTVNNKSFQLNGVSSSIVVDSDMMNTTENNGTINANNKMVGDFPIISPGINEISITINSGSFTTLEFEYFEKWL